MRGEAYPTITLSYPLPIPWDKRTKQLVLLAARAQAHHTLTLCPGCPSGSPAPAAPRPAGRSSSPLWQARLEIPPAVRWRQPPGRLTPPHGVTRPELRPPADLRRPPHRERPRSTAHRCGRVSGVTSPEQTCSPLPHATSRDTPACRATLTERAAGAPVPPSPEPPENAVTLSFLLGQRIGLSRRA